MRQVPVETNRIAAFRDLTQKTMGANWHRADHKLYQCMSNAIVDGGYTVAGRGIIRTILANMV